MAAVIGNVYTGNAGSSEGSSTFVDHNNLVLKPECKDWYIYRAGNGSVFKPYPVFDANGAPSPVINQPDPANKFSVLSEAFVVLPLATYTGLDGKLQFVDYCTDLQGYMPAGAATMQTPFWFMVKALKNLLPNEKTGEAPKSGFAPPQRLLQTKRNIHFAQTSILFRSAVMRVKGQQSKSKYAVDGVLFRGVSYIGTVSAVNSLIAELQKPHDQRRPWGPDNFMATDLFDLDGVALAFNKSGDKDSDPLNCSFTYDQSYPQTAMKAFKVNNAVEYHQKLRELFGPYQRLSDMLRSMTVEEMVGVLKEHFPISWVYYGLKDSPFAQLLTGYDREQALNDPDFAHCFGIADKPVVNTVNQAIQQPQQYPQTQAQVPPIPQVASYPPPPAPAAPQAPTWGQPTYGGNTANQGVQDKLSYYKAKYGNSNGGNDGIPM